MKHSKDRASGSPAGALSEFAFLRHYLIQKFHFQLYGCCRGDPAEHRCRNHSRSHAQHKLLDQHNYSRSHRAETLRTLFDDCTDGTVCAGAFVMGMFSKAENRAEYGQANQYRHQYRNESGFHIQHLLSAANTEMIINIIFSMMYYNRFLGVCQGAFVFFRTDQAV